MSVGDLVLNRGQNEPRGQWPFGIVEEMFSDRQDVVRQVTISTVKGRYRRDVRKLCLLEGYLDNGIQSSRIRSHNTEL